LPEARLSAVRGVRDQEAIPAEYVMADELVPGTFDRSKER
jgi:hypothetical protein